LSLDLELCPTSVVPARGGDVSDLPKWASNARIAVLVERDKDRESPFSAGSSAFAA
jgi:hypothetical protein